MEYINMDKRFKISKTLIIYFIFLLLFIIALSRPNDAYGYDSANSCSTQESKQTRRGRAQMLAAIPCDLTRQDYCHLPGSAYPWHAVRRFVHENHGLMKRMYGDVRHISVLRDEILNNEIDVDDYEDVAERYSKRTHRTRAAKYMQAQHEDAGSLKTNDELTEPHFRPVSTTTTTTTPPVSEGTIEESTSAANEKEKEAKMNDERPGLKRASGGAHRRRLNTTTNGASGNRRRINVYINRNRPLHSSLRRRTTTTTTTEEPKMVIENTEQTSETTMNEETVFQIAEDDGNLASNSVYEISTSPEAPLLPGDNIQIIESPQLGQLQKPLTEQKNSSEMATISTTLKVVTTPATKEKEPFGSASGSPASMASTPVQERPGHAGELQRPQTIKLYQVKKQNTTTRLGSDKDGSNFKLSSPNKSESLQGGASDPFMSSTTTEQALKATSNEQSALATNAGSGGTANLNSDSIWAPPKPAATLASASQISMQPQQDEDDANKADLASTTASASTKPASAPADLVSADKPTNSLDADASSDEEVEAHVEQITIDEKRQSSEELSQSTPGQTTPSSAIAAASKKPVLREAQLYQDAIREEVKAPPNVRGINACPGKEEVVAPFWANNTRGEVLALLNLYPFEQYVHWEKCTQENRQMFCREGCRCEQQYRLHRLLAYDPHNECRGIFSDWFRFPSCCICKCYNMPVEFRATSRSPRSERMDDFETVAEEADYEEDVDDPIGLGNQHERQHPLDAAEQLVRQAIYEHATEDWYRPRDDFDFYED